MVTCLIDKTEHETVEALHAHLRRFKVKQADYYIEHTPRRDLLTGELIPFKTYDQYMSADFVDKRNLKKWLKEKSTEGREWALKWLTRRKEEKSLVYAPSQAELRSLGGPSMPYYDSVGGYYTICASLGFKPRYVAEAPQFTMLPDAAIIIEDTREQTPLMLPVLTRAEKLDAGDYALAPPHDHGIRVERKSLNDFVGTLNARKVARKKGEDSALERFDRELARAAGRGEYVVMLVEASINDALSFDFLPHMRWTKVKPSHTFKALRDLLTKYPLSFQVVFADGRVDAAQKLMKVFEMGEQVKRVDLQYALERGIL